MKWLYKLGISCAKLELGTWFLDFCQLGLEMK